MSFARRQLLARVGLSWLLGPLLVCALASAASATLTPSQGAAQRGASWCDEHGSSTVGWLDLAPSLPICGPGPNYGGSWAYVDLPGPYGVSAGYYNATPGMQCVELAERYLAVADGLAPVHANGAQVARNYHAAYPDTALYLNGTSGHAPEPGDVVSFSLTPDFVSGGDGHVAVVVKSEVDRATGDGAVWVAQENVASSDYRYELRLEDWSLEDPSGSGAEFQFPYAEWLHPLTAQAVTPVALLRPSASSALPSSATLALPGLVRQAPGPVSVRAPVRAHLGGLVGHSLLVPTSELAPRHVELDEAALHTRPAEVLSSTSAAGPDARLRAGLAALLVAAVVSGITLVVLGARRRAHAGRASTGIGSP